MAERIAKWGALEDESDSEEVVEVVATVAPARGGKAAVRGKEKGKGGASLPAGSEQIDANGTKTVVSYTVNPDGQRVRVTRKVKATKNRKVVPDRVIARRNVSLWRFHCVIFSVFTLTKCVSFFFFSFFFLSPFTFCL